MIISKRKRIQDESMNHHALIVGGLGFLGSSLCQSLKRRGWKVTCASRHAGQTVDGMYMDITDYPSICDALEQSAADTLINLASYGVQYHEKDAEAMADINATGPRLLAKAAVDSGQIKRFFHAGSCFEYGHHSGLITETSEVRPTASYGFYKSKGTEAILTELSGRVPHMVGRLFSLWGEHEAAGRFMSTIFNAARNGREVALTGCDQLRDYIHVADAAELIATLLAHCHFGQDPLVNIASGDHRSLRDYAIAINNEMGNTATLNFGAVPYRDSEMMSLLCDNTLLMKYCSQDNIKTFEEHIRNWKNNSQY